MTHHLGSVPFDREEDPVAGWSDADDEPLVRPAWWRWVAVAVIVAMVVAGPFAYAIYKLLT